jgi:KaiC/GvpD/RAD55 family RecA-like ATPase
VAPKKGPLDAWVEEQERLDHLTEEQNNQVLDAQRDLEKQEEAGHILQFPWRALQDMCGNIVRGDVIYVCAFSGHGKTSWMMSFLELFFQLGRSIYYLGLETRPKVLRTEWACRRLQIHPGDALSGKLVETVEGIEQRNALKRELAWQLHPDPEKRIRFSPVSFMTAKELRKAAREAKSVGADVMIIDHIDHISMDGSGGGRFEDSVAVNHEVLRVAQENDMVFLVASQLNNDAVRGNPLQLYHPPRPEQVYMGGHKRQVASLMLGLYRPLSPNLTEDELKAARGGRLTPQQFTKPNTMGVVQMKNRRYGEREGARCELHIERGFVRDKTAMDDAMERVRNRINQEE